MGILLGLNGSGGSILTVPILVYVFGFDVVPATAYSLFVVGVTSAAGALAYFRQKLVDKRMVLLFGVSSVVTVALMRRFVVPAIPDHILIAGDLVILKDDFIMAVFAAIMILAAYAMLRRVPLLAGPTKTHYGHGFVLLGGLGTGLLTGLAGAGGGFIIIPALVLLTGMPIKSAIGTSLVIIVMNAAAGFLMDAAGSLDFDYRFLFLFTSFAIGGILMGSYFMRFIPGEKLKPVLGWVVLLTGLFMAIHTVYRFL